jgi:HK97 family phage major capsid protein
MSEQQVITAEQLRRGECGPMRRDMTVDVEKVDSESRVVTISFSSEYAVERYGWVETLGHDDGECDLSRLNNKGAFLNDHDWRDQRGVIERAWVQGKRGYADIKLSRNPLGQQLLLDMEDEIRVNVSVGYRINAARLEKTENDLEHYRVTKWQPFEISSVSVPADPTVGLGRADASTPNPVTITGVRTMDENEILDDLDPQTTEQTRNEPAPAATRQPAEPRKPVEQPVNEARQIAETAKQYGAVELGNDFIARGASLREFEKELMNTMHNNKRESPSQESSMINLDLPDADLRNYSVIKALRGAVTGNYRKAGLEKAVSDAIAQRVGRDPDGIFLSYEGMGYKMRQMQLRQQAAGTATKGAELVATELHSEMFIDALREQALAGQLGVRFVSGLVGDVDIPKQTGSATFYWVGEDGEPTDSDLTFSTVQLRPKTLSTAVQITRRMLIQSTPGIEALVLSDILRGAALALDSGVFVGSGAGNEPTGIKNTSGIGAVSFATAGQPTFAEMVEFETDVAEANADAGSMAYLMRPSLRGRLKTTLKATNEGFIYQDNKVNDYRAEVSTLMPAGECLFGDFSQAMVGMWGAMDVVPDKATKAASGGLVMRLFQDADVAVRHAQAFSYGS